MCIVGLIYFVSSYTEYHIPSWAQMTRLTTFCSGDNIQNGGQRCGAESTEAKKACLFVRHCVIWERSVKPIDQVGSIAGYK